VLALVFVSAAVFSLWFLPWWQLPWSLFLAYILVFVLALPLPRQIPQPIAGLGGLAVSCAAWNYGSLVEQAGGARRGDVWKVLTTILRECSGFKGEMDYNTCLFS